MADLEMDIFSHEFLGLVKINLNISGFDYIYETLALKGYAETVYGLSDKIESRVRLTQKGREILIQFKSRPVEELDYPIDCLIKLVFMFFKIQREGECYHKSWPVILKYLGLINGNTDRYRLTNRGKKMLQYLHSKYSLELLATYYSGSRDEKWIKYLVEMTPKSDWAIILVQLKSLMPENEYLNIINTLKELANQEKPRT